MGIVGVAKEYIQDCQVDLQGLVGFVSSWARRCIPRLASELFSNGQQERAHVGYMRRATQILLLKYYRKPEIIGCVPPDVAGEMVHQHTAAGPLFKPGSSRI